MCVCVCVCVCLCVCVCVCVCVKVVPWKFLIFSMRLMGRICCMSPAVLYACSAICIYICICIHILIFSYIYIFFNLFHPLDGAYLLHVACRIVRLQRNMYVYMYMHTYINIFIYIAAAAPRQLASSVATFLASFC